MGVAYYANYFVWFEEGRSDFFRKLGYAYRKMEQEGFFFPVVEAHCRYRQPARYDDLLSLETAVDEIGRGKVTFRYRLRKSDLDTLLAEGFTTHACVNRGGKPSRIPDEISAVLKHRTTYDAEQRRDIEEEV
jgi:acyl-CoA thioester hydrolase